MSKEFNMKKAVDLAEKVLERVGETPKHTPTPWIISTNGKHIANLSQNEIATFLSAENAYYAIEAINNYETLKAENAKLQESNNKMAELLKTYHGSLLHQSKQSWALHDKYKHEADADKVLELLTAAGHKV